jgi:hypothetical protein
MALSWNEIKHRAMEFSREFADEQREHAEAKTFWDAFFHVFGISRRRVASFEEPVKQLDKQHYGFIDLFWKGTLLVEHKSAGKDLDKAYSQALDYFAGLKDHELPKYVIVSDFARIRLYDLDENTHVEFKLAYLHKNVNLFGFIAGYTQKTYKDQAPVNIAAAEKMGKLHDRLLDSGYTGHPLEVLLMRLLFCMFADDTGIFEKNIFTDYIRDKTHEDGSDIGGHLTSIFQTMNTEPDKRQKNIDEALNAFPFVNGGLFAESLRTVHFDSGLREALLECCDFDWTNISPAVFGSMFQSVMDPKQRREIGAHYTTEKNILKLIEPLFLDDLKAEFDRIRKLKTGKNKRLEEFHQHLADLKFFDPACGCGNFLVITYRQLRRLEIEILKEIHQQQGFLGQAFSLVSVEQFYGIEIEEFPARIAETAMWLIDHQMNVELSMAVNVQRPSLPLVQSAHILNDNALQVDWTEFTPHDEIDYILGNPPFIGSGYMNKEQKKDMDLIFDGVKTYGGLDYVSAWYIKAAQYIQGTHKKVAFVSTNSITMGSQVGILWNELFKNYNIKIHFAHRTFSWSSEARGKAAVHVVIIGFAAFDTDKKFIYEYEDIKGEPHEITAININPYLANGTDITITNRTKPICNVLEMNKGSQPTDGGNLLLGDDEMHELIAQEPSSKKYIKRFVSGYDFLNNVNRWCLWLKEISPNELKNMPLVLERVNKVKEMRLASKKKATQQWAEYPTLFTEDRQPQKQFIAIPEVSSARRKYIPIGFLSADIVPNNKIQVIADASLYHFGILTSLMHMTWVNYVCGRLKSDFDYSAGIVYNNYPWPKAPTDKQIAAVQAAAQAVLDARAKFPDSSLADLYDPLTMPPELVRAHQALDKAVDKCYRAAAFTSETERLEYLFGLYNEYTQPLIKAEAKKKRQRRGNKQRTTTAWARE